MKKKTYTVTEELRDLMIQSLSEEKLRDRYIQLRYFGHKAASKAAFKSERCRLDFWKGVYEEWPELKGKKLTYDVQYNQLTVVQDAVGVITPEQRREGGKNG
jgi:hypothetical protein